MTSVSLTASFTELLASTVLTDTATETELEFYSGGSEQFDLLLTITANADTAVITLEVEDEDEGWCQIPYGGPETCIFPLSVAADSALCWTIYGLDRKEHHFRLRASAAGEAAELAVAAARKSSNFPFTTTV